MMVTPMSQHTPICLVPTTDRPVRRKARLSGVFSALSRAMLTAFTALPILASGADNQTVHVTLVTYGTTVSPAHIRPGTVRFLIRNDARHLTHEFFLVRTDLSPDKLPVGEEGKIDEDSPLIKRIVVAEDLAPGDEHDVTVRLQPGHYVYFCNIDAHHMVGMRGEFTIKPRFAAQ